MLHYHQNTKHSCYVLGFVLMLGVVVTLGIPTAYGQEYEPGYPFDSTGTESGGENTSGSVTTATAWGECWAGCQTFTYAEAYVYGYGYAFFWAEFEAWPHSYLYFGWTGSPGTGPGGSYSVSYEGWGGVSADGYTYSTQIGKPTASPSPPIMSFEASASGYICAGAIYTGSDSASVSEPGSDYLYMSGGNNGYFSGDWFSIYSIVECYSYAEASVYVPVYGWYAEAYAQSESSAYATASCEIEVIP